MIRNFLFHRVNPQRDLLWDPMDVQLFDKCIRYISKKYEVVLFEDIAHSEKLYSKKKIATIMFDDGYKDNIEYAAPILEKYNCKASFYIVSDCIDRNIPTWTHVLEYLFQHTHKDEIKIDFSFLPEALYVQEIVGKTNRINYVKKLKPLLKNIDHYDREQIMERIKSTYSDVELPPLMMNWNDLKQLRKQGHYVGAHTKSHPALGTITNEQLQFEEMHHSGNRIKEELGYFPTTISYPVGSFNKTTKELAQKAGFTIGLAVKQNIFNPKKTDLFEVDRIELYNEPWFKTKMRISHNLERIKKMIKYK